MSTLSLGTKRRVINSVAQHPVTIKGAGQAQVLNIEGFGTFALANIVGTYRASRAVAGNKTKHVIIPANLTLGAIADGTIVNMQVEITSDGWSMEFARYGESYGKPKNFQIVLNAGETQESVLRKIHAAIQVENIEDDFNLVKSTLAEPVAATTTDPAKPLTVTLEGRENTMAFKVKFTGDLDYGMSASAITGYKPQITKSNEGLNTYEQLRTIVLQNNTTVDPYSLESLQLAQAGGKYASIIFTVATERPELSGSGAASSEVKQKNSFQVYLQETAENAASRDAILNFLAAKTPALAKELTDKNGAVVADLAAFNA